MKIVVLLISLVAACYANSQEINFKELGRAGSPVVKRYVVDGVALDGQSYLKKFDGIDTARVEARRAAAASSASYSGSQSSSGSSSQQSSAAKGPKQYECKVYCKRSDGPVTYKTVSAGSRSEAAKMVGDNADQICSADGYSYASSKSFPESQCREK